jgi:hypothetical protein
MKREFGSNAESLAEQLNGVTANPHFNHNLFAMTVLEEGYYQIGRRYTSLSTILENGKSGLCGSRGGKYTSRP